MAVRLRPYSHSENGVWRRIHTQQKKDPRTTSTHATVGHLHGATTLLRPADSESTSKPDSQPDCCCSCSCAAQAPWRANRYRDREKTQQESTHTHTCTHPPSRSRVLLPPGARGSVTSSSPPRLDGRSTALRVAQLQNFAPDYDHATLPKPAGKRVVWLFFFVKQSGRDKHRNWELGEKLAEPNGATEPTVSTEVHGPHCAHGTAANTRLTRTRES